MIYTLTLNPALDYIINVNDYEEGRVNRTAKEKVLPGGKGLNVSAVLNELGEENTAFGFASGFTGDFILNMLGDSGIKCDFVTLNGGFSRINIKIKAREETDINGMGPQVNKTDLEKLYKKLDMSDSGDFLVLAGSVPKNLGETAYCDILEYLDGKNIKAVVDATGKQLINTLKYNPFLIKPNIFELEEVFGRKLEKDKEIIACAKRLREMGALNVLVSMGEDGAILIDDKGEVLRQKAVKGKAVNTTGSGDSMVAGFISGYIKKGNYDYALKLAVAAGSASAFSENLANKEEIYAVFEKIC